MRVIENIEKAVSVASVAVMSVLVFVNVIARFVFRNSLAFSDEISSYLFILMSFMGSAIAARRKAHLGLSIVTDRLSFEGRKRLGMVMYGISAFFCLLIVIFGAQMVMSEIHLGQETATMQWPEWIYGLFVPVGGAFTMIAFIAGIFDIANQKEEE